MQFIDQKEILEKTEGGRVVIELYYPNSVHSFNDTRRKFKSRDTEKTASASLKKLADGTWIVTDFGADQKSRNCIQVVMLEENCDFKTAINIIAVKFNIIPEEKKLEIFKPQVTRRTATPDELDGKWYFKTKEFTMVEVLTIIAPKVWEYLLKQVPKDAADKLEEALAQVKKVFHEYHFHSLVSYTMIKDREATEIAATDLFPIFMFDEGEWKKIYKPKELDGGRRFVHYGGRPDKFLFGHTQAIKAYNEVVKIADDEVDDDKGDDQGKKKPAKPKKLKQLIIASGGSDALNLAVIGQCFKSKKIEHIAEQIFPIWMNSETAKLAPGELRNLQSICETLYNLPDIDATGLRQAHKLAMGTDFPGQELPYLNIRTIYLPAELREKTDGFRNKACKDLRDYFRFYTPHDFLRLFKTAYPYIFWDLVPNYNKKGEFTKMGFNVNNKHLLNFLQRNGFFRYATESEKDLYFYIHIKDNIVTKVEPKKIRDYINAFIEARNPEVELMNTFLRTTQLNENSLSNLPFIEIDFTDYDKDSQWFFFKNRTAKVTSEKIEHYRPGETDKYVWSDEVIKYKLTDETGKAGILPDFFTITQPSAEIIKIVDGKPVVADPGRDSFDIQIHNMDCMVLRYLINGSRIYWRDELETRLEGVPEKERDDYAALCNLSKDDLHIMEGYTKEKQAEYREKYKFALDGPLLTALEVKEHKLHLINKLYTLGYIFHRYKDPSKAWAIWSMDAKNSDGDESHGGSGKSLGPMLIRENKLMKTEYKEGRNPKLTDNPHVFEGMTKDTDLVIVDDCNRYIKFEFFFAGITGPLQVNPKNSKQYTIEHEDSPKFLFTSNYPPHNIDPSKERRLLYNLFSDYYHYSKMGEYREERKVSDDFGKNLGRKGFDEKDWNLYLNLILQANKFYLSCAVKVNPPMENVNKRNLKALMGDAFQPWADVYFSDESGRLNCMNVKTDALNDFLKSTKQNWTTQKFTSALHAWCTYNNYQLDPKEFKNAQNRIIRKVKETTDAGVKEVTKEMIWIRTVAPDEVVLEEKTNSTGNTMAPADTKEEDEDLPF